MTSDWLCLEDDIKLNLIAAKSYVAFLKRSSPTIELMSAIILTRLIASICKELTYLWTDSTVLMHWLKMAATCFKPFESAQIQEIRDMLDNDISCFLYIRLNLNSADALTKPIAVSKLTGWHKVPDFLKNRDTILTLTSDAPNNIVEILQSEMKIVKVHHTNIDSFETVLLHTKKYR